MRDKWGLASKMCENVQVFLCFATIQKSTDPFDTSGLRASTMKD